LIIMETLQNKNLVVIGASRGLGRKIVIAGQESGAHVLAVARRPGPLAELSAEQPAVRTLALDATEEDAPERVFETLRPDVLVLCGGAIPQTAPLQELNWEQFSRNWNSDVRISFHFCQAALRTPLAPGATILLISSGAAIGGSPVSGATPVRSECRCSWQAMAIGNRSGYSSGCASRLSRRCGSCRRPNWVRSR
jgi:NAD(P)-dependent dehydrogenase (short-subunit alcohol dehydrogenase family)